MTHLEQAARLRCDPAKHYNCAQAVLMSFARECGLTPSQAEATAAHFGAGMRMGATCGALTGALMTLGLLGADQTAAQALLAEFRRQEAETDCAKLLCRPQNPGTDRYTHCDQLVFLCVSLVEEYLRQA